MTCLNSHLLAPPPSPGSSSVMNKGQCVTKYYRWIQKSGGYIWIQSSATIAINAKNASEKNIVWVNYVLSNPEYKDTPMDIAQLPNLPEKTCESSESSDSESESKDNSGRRKQHLRSEASLAPPARTHIQDRDPGSGRGAASSTPLHRCQLPLDGSLLARRTTGLTWRNISCPVQPVNPQVHLMAAGGVQLLAAASVGRRARERVKGWTSITRNTARQPDTHGRVGGRSGTASRSRRLRISTSPGPVAVGDGAQLAEPSQATPTSALLPAASPEGGAPASSVLKIKTEMAEPINFDNDSSIWNYPPNREISRNEPPYSMSAKAAPPGGHDGFPSPQGGGALQVSIPDSVLTPPGTEGGARKLPYNGSSAPSSASSLAPPSSTSSADPLRCSVCRPGTWSCPWSTGWPAPPPAPPPPASTPPAPSGTRRRTSRWRWHKATCSPTPP
uniref:PAS fold-3 domain-containing protein n=1 Tax=Tetraodon nigroviridis TaxID=99883 RepID=H3CAZ0_TETNG